MICSGHSSFLRECWRQRCLLFWHSGFAVVLIEGMLSATTGQAFRFRLFKDALLMLIGFGFVMIFYESGFQARHGIGTDQWDISGNYANQGFLLSSMPYQMYVTPDTISLNKILQGQGYTGYAMHPFPASNWNREEVFQDMGFAQFLSEPDFAGEEMIRDMCSDAGDYDRMIKLYEEKKEARCFSLT